MEPIVFRELWMERCEQVQALPERDNGSWIPWVRIVLVYRNNGLGCGEKGRRDA